LAALIQAGQGDRDPFERARAQLLHGAREVEEETALRCLLGRELATTSHRDGKGRLKIVRYWMMDPGEGVAEPRNEVDEVRWLSLEDAAQLLTYPRDRELLIAFSGQVASSR